MTGLNWIINRKASDADYGAIRLPLAIIWEYEGLAVGHILRQPLIRLGFGYYFLTSCSIKSTALLLPAVRLLSMSLSGVGISASAWNIAN